MKNHIPIENRLARAKSFKTDSVIKASQLQRRLEALHKHFQKLSDQEINEMWPSTEYTSANDNSHKLVHKKKQIKDKEFLITLLARVTQTQAAIKFAQEKANIDLNNKETQDAIKQRSEEVGRVF